MKYAGDKYRCQHEREQFKDTKWEIRNRISKKNRQYND